MITNNVEKKNISYRTLCISTCNAKPNKDFLGVLCKWTILLYGVTETGNRKRCNKPHSIHPTVSAQAS